jgi:hypothetical protein
MVRRGLPSVAVRLPVPIGERSWVDWPHEGGKARLLGRRGSHPRGRGLGAHGAHDLRPEPEIDVRRAFEKTRRAVRGLRRLSRHARTTEPCTPRKPERDAGHARFEHCMRPPVAEPPGGQQIQQQEHGDAQASACFGPRIHGLCGRPWVHRIDWSCITLFEHLTLRGKAYPALPKRFEEFEGRQWAAMLVLGLAAG